MRRSLAVLVAAALVQAPAAAGWSWPVDGPVLRSFALGNDPYAAGQHRGIDIGAAPGTTVRAAAAGSVSFVGTVPAGGRAVTVRTAGGLSVTYLELGTTRVERGSEIAEGDAIGTIGPASHVHLGVRVTADEHGYLDPLQFLPPRVTGTARADPVPEPSVGGQPPEPVTEAADRAEPPVADLGVKPKADPTPVAAAPSASVAAPSPAPVATEPAPAPATAAPAPRADVGETVPATPVRAPAAHDPGEPSQARKVTASERATAVPVPHRVRRPASSGSPGQREARAPRPRDRRVPTPAAPSGLPRVKQKPVSTTPAQKTRAVEPHRGVARMVDQTGSDRSSTPVLLVAVVLLSAVLGVVAEAVSRRRRDGTDRSPLAGRCSLGRMRPPRLLHECVRAGDVGWPATATRSPSPVTLYRPLPRPRRRAPVELSS
jgi:hypothetical protein